MNRFTTLTIALASLISIAGLAQAADFELTSKTFRPGAAIGAENDRVAHVLVSTVLILGLAWIALAMRGLGSRYVQTASALVACSIVFSLLVLPLAFLAGPLPTDAALTPLQTLLVWASFALFVWSVLVDAHIIRRALDAPFGLGVALALAWTIADWALGHALFDAAAQ